MNRNHNQVIAMHANSDLLSWAEKGKLALLFTNSNIKMKTFFHHHFPKCLYTVVLSLLVNANVFAANEPIASGSFIINMGITPQTINNGLKPYGMVYDLVKNYYVPIKWVINSTKAKDGIDFSHNGIAYRGGTFIVPAEFRSAAINARITYWQSQGVVGATSVAPITVEVNMTLRSMPNWTFDATNGSIAKTYLTATGIPTTAYNDLAPASLTCCNDIFVMPHADPTWAKHSRLFSWNLDCDGAIWLACHAGSATMDLFNPANKSQQMNFLSNKTGNAVGAGPYEQNSLILWGNHDDGSPAYNYFYPADPIMQFMGTFDGATQNGSEQIYLPKVSWNPGAKVYVTDPTQANVPALSPGPAAILVSGRGFNDPARGRVMLEAGHDHNKSGTTAEKVAAQRAFMNFSFLTISEKAIVPTLNSASTSFASSSANTLSFTLPSGVSASNYTITWSSSCGGTFSPSNGQTTTYTAPNLAVATPCVISVSIRDACGRTACDSKAVTVGGCTLTVTPTITNVSCSGGSTSGAINMAITGGTSPTWTWTRTSPAGTGSGSGTAITGLSVGTYSVTVTASGCSKTFQSIITASPAVTATATGTNPLCFGASTGSIAVSTSGGTAPFTYSWSGGITTQNRSAIPAGAYSVTVTDSKGCTATASATLTAPTDMVITPTLTQVACFGNSTGAINIAVSGGTGTKTYAWSNGAATQNITGLVAGTYSVTVTDANGCTKTSSNTITQPASGMSLSSTAINYACATVKGSIDLTVSGGTGPFTYAWSNGATTEDISGLNVGNYTVTVTDSKGCTAVLSKTIVQGPAFNLSTSIINSTCPTPGTGSIDLTVAGGALPYTYAWADGPTTQDRTALLPGNYSVVVTDASGCTASIAATITALQGIPNAPTVVNH